MVASNRAATSRRTSSRIPEKDVPSPVRCRCRVRDEVRRDVAARLLATTEIPLYQIASALALDDVTTFSQYARRWWGVTARQFRADRRGPGAVGRPAIELS